LRVQVGQEVERKFRELAMRRFGYGKGALSKAAEEAIMKWISANEKENLEFRGDPVEAIVGLLSGIDVDSVELQHDAKKTWSQKVLKSAVD
jgi:hypothetical protein